MRRDAEAEAVRGGVCADCARGLGGRVGVGGVFAGANASFASPETISGEGKMMSREADLISREAEAIFPEGNLISAAGKATSRGAKLISRDVEVVFPSIKMNSPAPKAAHASEKALPRDTIFRIPPTFTQVTPAIADDHLTPQSKSAETKRHWTSGTGHWCKGIAHASATPLPPPRLSAHSPSSSATRFSWLPSGLAGEISVGL